jgi:hypothetical protein
VKFGDFEKAELLGGGEYGEVFLAQRKTLGVESWITAKHFFKREHFEGEVYTIVSKHSALLAGPFFSLARFT